MVSNSVQEAIEKALVNPGSAKRGHSAVMQKFVVPILEALGYNYKNSGFDAFQEFRD